jgi:hypothetical protein
MQEGRVPSGECVCDIGVDIQKKAFVVDILCKKA